MLSSPVLEFHRTPKLEENLKLYLVQSSTQHNNVIYTIPKTNCPTTIISSDMHLHAPCCNMKELLFFESSYAHPKTTPLLGLASIGPSRILWNIAEETESKIDKDSSAHFKLPERWGWMNSYMV